MVVDPYNKSHDENPSEKTKQRLELPKPFRTL